MYTLLLVLNYQLLHNQHVTLRRIVEKAPFLMATTLDDP